MKMSYTLLITKRLVIRADRTTQAAKLSLKNFNIRAVSIFEFEIEILTKQKETQTISFKYQSVVIVNFYTYGHMNNKID